MPPLHAKIFKNTGAQRVKKFTTDRPIACTCGDDESCPYAQVEEQEIKKQCTATYGRGVIDACECDRCVKK
jgi:hypothetical protein